MTSTRSAPRIARPYVFALALVLAIVVAGAARADAPRERLLLDPGWRFQLGDPADVSTNSAETNVAYYPEIHDLAKLQTDEITGAGSETNLATLRPGLAHLGENVSTVQTNFDDSAWRPLNLPHDWIVELPFSSTADKGHGYKSLISGTTSANTVGWYRRTFTLPSSYSGKTLSLEFDGVYRNCLVWLNGHILGRNVSGYSGFSFDVSSNAIPGGTNVLVVRVDASRFEGWFYEGAGIYRHVWLVKTDPVHVAHWGTFVTNIVSGSNALVTIQTQVNNDSANPVTCNLASQIFDANSNLIAAAAQSVTIAAGTNQLVTQSATITNVHLWSPDFPNLYQLLSTVSQGSVTNDVYQTPFGVRTIAWDPNNGLLLNGRRIEIQGMCNHQDHAGVGIAVPDRVQYFRVETLKEMGCNVYRTSHNSPAPETLNACDRLGLLVLDENRRVGNDPETLGQLQRGIVRDRNHPSVFAWSLGNEEKYIQGSSTGAVVITSMQNLAHQLDPTRLCTVAMNGSWGSGFSTVIDVQGFNYQHQGNMDSFHTTFPNLPAMSTEEGSAYYTRGVYTNTSTYKSAYDNNIPGYGTTAEQWWQYYTARPWNAGACYWTGFDYRGEPSPFSWPNISSEFGTIDTCGFPKDTFFYYQANWTPRPVLHLFPHWNWSAGQTINVWCFSDCDAVELFLNGASQGRQSVNVMSHLEWNVPFAPGTLRAVGYQNGRPVLTNSVTTAGPAAAIALQPDRSTILADGQDVSLVTISVVDTNGFRVPTASNMVTFTVSGGAIIGVGNGDPTSHEVDRATNNVWQRSLFNGLAQVIVQSTNQSGPITLTATAAGLTSAIVVINAVTNLPPPQSPAGLSAIAGNAQVVVSWDIVPGSTTYNVKRATTSGGPYALIATNTGAIGYTDTNVINGTNYFYVVSAIGPGGESGNSSETGARPMALVSGLVATPASAAVNVTWKPALTALNYNIKRATNSGGPYSVIAAGVATTNYTDTSVVCCTTYYYVVALVDAAGEEANSSEAAAAPEFLQPPWQDQDIGSVGFAGGASQCGGVFTVSGSGADIWGTADAFHYVYQSMTNDGAIVARVVSQSGTDGKAGLMIRQSLAANSPYVDLTIHLSAHAAKFEYRLTTGGSAANNASVSSINAPYWLKLARTNNVFTAYTSSNGTTWTQAGTSVTNILSNPACAGLCVTAHNNSALVTAVIDNLIFPQPAQPCPPPTGLIANPGSAIVCLNWNAVPGAISYNVKRAAVAGGPYTIIATNVNAASFGDTTVTNGTGYYYVVTSVDAAGEGLHSAEVAATPLASLASLTVTAVALGQNGNVLLNFSTAASQSYRIESSSNLTSGNWSIVVDDIPGTGGIVRWNSFPILPPSPRFYRIRAL